MAFLFGRAPRHDLNPLVLFVELLFAQAEVGADAVSNRLVVRSRPLRKQNGCYVELRWRGMQLGAAGWQVADLG